LRARDIAFATWALLCGLVCLLLYPLNRVPPRGGEPGGARQAHAPAPAPRPNQARPNRARLLGDYGRLPLHFEENRGQTDGQVRFLSRGAGYALFLTRDEAVLQLRNANPANPQGEVRNPHSAIPNPQSAVVRLKLLGANQAATAAGQEELPGKANYFIGSDPSRWRTNIPTYAKVHYRNVYAGVDLVYYGNQRQLEHDFVVAPGADPKQIRLAVEGAERLELEAQGDAVLRVGDGEVRLRAPLAYQEINGRRQPVTARYALQARNPRPVPMQSGSAIRNPKSEELSFELGAYDPALPLVIDPVLVYSTYLGGSDGEFASAIAVDSSGCAYITGYTYSTDFPTNPPNARQGPGNTPGYNDVFISKLNAAGSALVYSTYLGGSDGDWGKAIAVDSSGNAYITGGTLSTDFPTNPPNARQGPSNTPGYYDAFVAKLNAAGSALVYSTYLGGGYSDEGRGIAVDGSGNAYVAGWTSSDNFLTTTGAFQPAPGGGEDAFVAKLNPAGSGLVYSTYLGGNYWEYANGIAVDSSGNAYVAGSTYSDNFPTTPGALQPGKAGDNDAFVAKLNPSGSLLYSTYLGGESEDEAYGIAVDGSGNAYVTGYTDSIYFPTYIPLQDHLGGDYAYNAFVTKLSPAGSALVYSTYLGGSNDDEAYGIAVDSSGNAYIAGWAYSTDFPLANPLQATRGGDCCDAFVTALDATGTALLYSTYLGGSGGEGANGIAVDSSGNAYVAGSTDSSDFPRAGLLQPVFGGYEDAFVLKIGTAAANDLALTKTGPPSASVGSNITYSLTVTNNGPGVATGVTLIDPLPPNVTFVSATPTAGTCGGTATVTCNLGSLANGAGATVALVVQAAGGTVTNVASVTGNEAESAPSNNRASADTVINGPPAPIISSLDPPKKVAGEPAFTLTINGSNFSHDNSAVNWNGVSRPTTYVSSTQLTTEITAEEIAVPTAAQVSVFDSMGGGWSNSVPFVVYAMSGQAGCVSPPADLKLWWPAESDTNDLVSGNWAYGSVNYSPGKVGLAFDFGGDSYLYLPYSYYPTMTGQQITIDAWIMPRASDGRIVDKITPGGSDGYLLDMSGGQVRFIVGSNWLAATVPLNTWSHVAAVYDGTNLKLYINGQFQGTADGSGTVPANSLNFTIGADTYGSTRFNGLIDELEIFDRALTPVEIAGIVSAGSVGKCWPFAAAPVDLQLAKSAPSPTAPGYPFIYTLTVYNISPNDAYGVTLTDTLPPGLTLRSAYPYQGSCTGESTITCSLGTIYGMNYTTVKLEVQADQGKLGMVTNAASVGSVSPDTDMSNNIASVDVTLAVLPPVISYTDPDSAVAGSDGLHLGIFGLYLQPNSVVRWNGSERTPAFCPYGLALYIDLTPEDLARPGVAWFTVYDLDTGLESAPYSFLIYANSPEGCVRPPSGMVSWWAGEGNGNDVFGRNPGTPRGSVAFAPGEVGRAFSLDGSSYIEVSDSPSLAIPYEITIDAWIKRTADTPGCAKIVDKITPGGADGFLLDVCPDEGGNYHLRMAVGQWLLTGIASIPLNEFVHVAGTFDGEYLDLYVNGVQDGSMYVYGLEGDASTGGRGQGRVARQSVKGKLNDHDYVYFPIPTNHLSLLIGANHEEVPGEKFVGVIDELEIYNRALYEYSYNEGPWEGEITDIYNAGPAGKCNPFACTPPPSGLVSWWAGETDGRDLTGANPATPLGNITLVPAMVGQGFHFDGTNSYLQVADSPSLRPQAGFTIDAWVKFDSLDAPQQVLVSKYDTLGETAGYMLYVTPIEMGRGFAFKLASAYGPLQLTSMTSITPGVFYHVAATWDGTTNEAYLYVNGVMENGGPADFTVDYDTRPLLMGSSGDSQWFAGTLDEVEFYGRALSSEEIASLYMAGGAGKCTAAYSPDLALTKEATLNSNLTYTLTVTNNSAQAATGVTVTDPLPEGVSFVSAVASPGTCTTSVKGVLTVSCDLGTLAGGAVAGITLVTQPAVSGEVVNTATVTLNEADPDTFNNTATVTTTIVANPLPAITSLSPPGAVAGGGDFALDVLGSNFVTGSVVQWKGSPRTTKFMSSGQLTATIYAADIALPGAALVTVVNPPPGGGESTAVSFTINNPMPAITSFSPPTAVAGTPGLTLTVIGVNFVPGAVVRWNGQDRTTTPVDSTHLSAAITPADVAVAGTALVTVFNPAPGGGTSSPAPFTIGYLVACTPPPSGLVGWWPGDGNGQDIAGGNHASLQGGLTFASGMAGQAFNLNGTSSYAKVPAASVLDVGAAGTGLTIDAWIYPTDVSSARPIVEWNDASNVGVHLWHSTSPGVPNDPGALFTNIVDTSGAYHVFSSPGGLVGTSAFQHVALTYDKTSGVATLYLNGLVIAQQNLGAFAPQTSYDLYFGRRPAGPGPFAYYAGAIDEIEIYSRALSVSEIQGIYNAGALGKCRAPMPAIASLLPSSGTAGGAAFPLIVSGSNFQSDSVVRWNGANRATTYAGATQLTASIPATDIALVGTAQVTVFTPLAGESAPATFTITGLTACVAPPSGLVSWWPGETGAQDIADGNSGTLVNGATTAPGKVGQALSFDGVDDRVLVAFNSNMNPTGPFTADLWLKASPQQFSGDGIFMLVDKSHGWVDSTGWGISGFISDGTLSFFFGEGGGGPPANFVGASTGVSVLDDQWHHFAGVYTGSTIEVYLDGVLRQSTPYSGPPVNNNRDLYMGASWGAGTPTRHFHGLVDELEYYNRALSVSEIQGIYNAGALGKCLVPVPGLASILPAAGNRLQTLDVVLTGTNYIAGATSVSFGPDITVNSANVSSPASLTANISIAAAAATGPRDVTVTNPAPGGGMATLPAAFTVNNPQPALASIAPVAGNRLQTLNVVLTGTNYIAGATSVSFGPDITVNSANVSSSTALTANISIAATAATGPRDVTVTNPAPGGGTATLAAAFTVNSPLPTLASILPAAGNRLQTLDVVLTGTNYIAGATSVSFGPDITVNSANVTSPASLTANISIAATAATGPRDVTVTNPAPGGGTATLAAAFTVNNPAPTLASSAPMAGNRLQTLDVVLTGTNYIHSVSTLSFGADITVNNTTVTSATSITANITITAAAATGPRDLSVTHGAPGGGTAKLLATFTVNNPVPSITSLSQTAAVAGTPGLALTVTGSSFVPGSVVRWNGQDRTTTPVDSAHLSAAITTADLAVAGTALVTVFNPAPGGGTTSPAPFTIGFLVACTPPPSGLVGWWPGDGNAWDLAAGNNGTPFNGADFAAGVVGQGFSLSGVSQYLDVGNPAALRVSAGDFTVDTWVKFNSLTHPPGSVTGPAGDMSIMDKMSATGINQDGWRLFKQDNNHFWFCLGGGGANGCGGGPSTLVQSATVATTGVWYHVTAVKTSSTISIYVNGVKETTTSLGPFTDTHAASLKIGASAAEGSYLNGLVDEAEVFNRALSDAEIATIYNASALGKCRAPMPAITSLLPSSATAGGAAFPLVVSGSNFQSNSVVRWNLSDRATTYGSATQLTAAIPATDIALAGTPKVTVFTPLGGESAPATFTITGLIACAAPPSGLVSWWTGEAGAQDITDGNSGTLLNGAATAPGEVGQALSFDGVDDRVLVPFNANLSPAGPFAVAVWFKPDPSQFSGDGLFMLVDKSHGFVDGTGWALQGVPAASSLSLGRNSVAGEMTFGFGLGGSSAEENYFAVGTGISVRDNVWHHVVGMFTGSEVQIYLDGILKESRPQATLPVNNSRDLYIGAAWGGGSPTRHFHGLIDEVQYFGRALSLAEIQKIVNAGGYGLCHQADLALTMTAPSSSTLGVNVNYTLTVTNNGPVAASGVVGILPLPVGASLVSSGASQGSCASSAVVTCALGNIGPGAAVTVNLLLHPTQSGTLTATASVSGNESDPMPSNNTAGASTSLSGWVYVVGDSAPGAGDGMGGFGDGMLDNLDLIGTLRAVTWVPGFRPPDCSDRFDAIDAYPTDTEVLRGGDGILDNLDLLASLRRVTNADPSRPTRTTLGCPTRAPGVVAMRRPALGPAGNLRLEFGEARADAGRGVVPIYLVGAARLDLMGLSLALGLPGSGGAPLAWRAGEAGAPTLTDNGLPGTLALSWLGGLRLQAGQRVLLGYAEVPGGAPASALQFIGAIANAADGRPLAVGLPSLTVEQR